MKRALLAWLACPRCRGSLALENDPPEEVLEGWLACASCGARTRIAGGIPRFVPDEDYAGSFGWQWRRFSRTQLDRAWGIGASGERFWRETRWPRDLRGEVILEVGAGAGRFTEHAAASGATVLSFDRSRAIEAARENHAALPDVHFFQADLRAIPVRLASCDKVYCFGVLQHTPDPRASFRALLPFLKPGGEIVVDVYRLSWRSLLAGKYWIRPFVKRLAPERLFPLVERWVGSLWRPLGLAHRLLGPRGWVAGSLLGIADYRGIFDLPDERQRELALLDTFDMWSPAHDHPQTLGTVRRWFEEADLADVEVAPGYNGIEARGRAPAGSSGRKGAT